MSEAQRLRDKAVHARELAGGLAEKHARAALEALAVEFERQATGLEAQDQSGHERPAPRSDTPLEFDPRRFLPTRLTGISNRLTRRAAELYGKRFNLSAPEWRIIAVLGHQGAISGAGLIAETAMDKVRVSRAIAKLLKAGLITRDTDPGDRRRAILALAGPGGELFQQIIPLIQDADAEMMTALSDAERGALSEVLAKIEGYLKRIASDTRVEIKL